MKRLARLAIAVVAVALVVIFLRSPSASADTQSPVCHNNTDWNGASVGCVRSGAETAAYFVAHSEHAYTIRPACKVGGQALCAEQDTCKVDGHDGLLFDVLEDGVLLKWQACLTDQEAQNLGTVTPGLVEHRFRSLTWPSSELVIQPPNGRSLVNFDTNFYTTNTAPTTKSVTLLGQKITVEATPVDYVWHFGSGTTDGDLTTADAGAAYPDLRVIYRYTRTGTVQPSVDTVYSGRYRVGNGTWRTIPDPLTVPGAAQDLIIVSATPHLVGY